MTHRAIQIVVGLAVAMSSASIVAFLGHKWVATIDLERGAIIAHAPTADWFDGVAFSSPAHASRDPGK
jgi:hypothetical protein